MTNIELLAEAKMVIERYIRVNPGERVVVIGDRGRAAEAEALATAVRLIGADCLLVDATQQVDRTLAGSDFWVDPPSHLVACVQASNVGIFVVDETYAFRLDHKVRHIWRTGADCSVFKVDLGLGTWGLTEHDIELATRNGEAIMNAMANGSHVQLTSSAGTELSLSIRGRECLPVVPVPGRGHPFGISVPLWSEYNWAPIEDQTEGRVVIDGISEAAAQIQVVREPIVLDVHEGRAKVQAGGPDAEALARVFQTDSEANVVAELGIGAHHRARPGTETEKALLGTAHLGFGDNAAYPGGMSRSVVHVDAVMRQVSIAVDGQQVIRAGEIVI